LGYRESRYGRIIFHLGITKLPNKFKVENLTMALGYRNSLFYKTAQGISIPFLPFFRSMPVHGPIQIPIKNGKKYRDKALGSGPG